MLRATIRRPGCGDLDRAPVQGSKMLLRYPQGVLVNPINWARDEIMGATGPQREEDYAEA
jgi:hypothetical protein